MSALAKSGDLARCADPQPLANGTQLRAFSPEIMEASYKAANETDAAIGAANLRFKKIYGSFVAFRNESYSWWQVCDLTFDAAALQSAR